MAKKLTREMIVQKARSDRIQSLKNINLWGNNLDDVSLLAEIPSLEIVSLSVNKIRSLQPFENLTNLKELYLRKNLIADLREVQYLQNCDNLRILWLNDNPIADNKNYRQFVIKCLPQLVKLDDVMITDSERNNGAYEVKNYNNNNEESYEEEEPTPNNTFKNLNKNNEEDYPPTAPIYNNNHKNDNENIDDNNSPRNVKKKISRYEEQEDKYIPNYGNDYRQKRSMEVSENIRKAPSYGGGFKKHPSRDYYHNNREEEDDDNDEYEEEVRQLTKNYNINRSGRRSKTSVPVKENYNYTRKFENINENYEDDDYERYDNRNKKGNFKRENNLSGVAQSIIFLLKELNKNELMIVKREVDRSINEY